MIAPATMYGLIRFHSLWYAPNLLAAMAIPGWAERSASFLSSFHLEGLLVAVVVHALASALVGLLYGAIFPMFPWEPIATAGFLVPHSSLERTLVWWISRREPDHESAD